MIIIMANKVHYLYDDNRYFQILIPYFLHLIAPALKGSRYIMAF